MLSHSADSGDAYSRYLYGGRGPNSQTFPQFCDSFALISKPSGTLMIGYRNATLEMLAVSLSGAVGQGRPVIDPKPDASERPGPTSLEALRDQLGLKIESTKGPVQILVIDKVARPSAN